MYYNAMSNIEMDCVVMQGIVVICDVLQCHIVYCEMRKRRMTGRHKLIVPFEPLEAHRPVHGSPRILEVLAPGVVGDNVPTDYDQQRLAEESGQRSARRLVDEGGRAPALGTPN